MFILHNFLQLNMQLVMPSFRIFMSNEVQCPGSVLAFHSFR